MNRTSSLRFCVGMPFVAALSILLTGCGGGSAPIVTVPPPATYSISAAELSSTSVAAGTAATSALTVTALYGYSGTVTLSCSVTGMSTPAPTCVISPNPVNVSSAMAANSTMTVTTATTNPSGAYNVSVTGKDVNGLGPNDGAQSLALNIKFQHIVIIVQENRTPDNMFQDPNLIAAGADIASSGKDSTGATVQLQPTTLGIDYDISHENQAWATMCDYNPSTGTCAMDKADQISPISCTKGSTNCPPVSPPPEFYYVQQSDVQPYWDMAEQYTFGDHMFQTNEGPSFPAHQFLISGTSEPSVNSTLFVAENPLGVSNSSADTGCTSPSAEYVATINAAGVESPTGTGIYPCFEHPTLTDELNTAGVTWRYYAPIAGSIWTAPNAIEHMCAPPYSTSCTAPDWVNNVSLNTSSNPAPILTDIAAGQLQQVSWVIPTGSNSDHAGDVTTTGGPSWVASIVNAIGSSAVYWPNTAIIIIWDDWGGWYDHVPPPKVINDGSSWGSGYVYGFRVPLIVVSPLAKPKYISTAVHDFGSILNFIEGTFNLQPLGFADSNTTDDLSDCFNFSQTPNVFQTINAPLKADFFLHDKRPPTPPDND